MTSASGEGAVQLRASGERAVLVGHDGVAEREMDPRRLPLGGDLTDALHEWAKVANAIRRATAPDDPTGDPPSNPAGDPPSDPAGGSAGGSMTRTIDRSVAAGTAAVGSTDDLANSTIDRSETAGEVTAESRTGPADGTIDRSMAGSAAEVAAGSSAESGAGSAAGSGAGSVVGSAASAVVSRRGLQLAARVAAAIGVPVHYVDPLSGETVVVDPPDGRPPRRPVRPPEPVPWLTGLTVTAASLMIVTFTVVTLAVTLAETYPLLALAANVVVTVGLLPSLWLIHRQPIWRWVAFGAGGGIALGWLALPFILL